MRDPIHALFDPAFLYHENTEPLRKWLQDLWQYTHDMNDSRSPGFEGLKQIEIEMRSICEKHDFTLVQNKITQDEDKIYTLDVPFAQGFVQLIEVTTDMVDLVECEILLDEMLENLDFEADKGPLSIPEAWNRQAGHYLVSEKLKTQGINLRAFEPTAVIALDRHSPEWRQDPRIRREIESGWLRLPGKGIETQISTSAGVAALSMMDHERGWKWRQGELRLRRDIVSETIQASIVGQPLSRLVDIPAFSQSNLTVQRTFSRETEVIFQTAALDLENLEILEHLE